MVFIGRMRIKFLKPVTVDIIDADNGTNDTYDKLYRSGDIVEITWIADVSSEFSNIRLLSGEWMVDVKKDCFEEVI